MLFSVSKLTTNAKKNSSHLRMSRAISPILSETNDQDSLLDTESQLPLESLNDETSELDIDLDIDLDLELQKLADEQRHITRCLLSVSVCLSVCLSIHILS